MVVCAHFYLGILLQLGCRFLIKLSLLQMGVRRFAGDESGSGKQHLVRLRHPLVRQHESPVRPFQPRHRLRRRSGKIYFVEYLNVILVELGIFITTDPNNFKTCFLTATSSLLSY